MFNRAASALNTKGVINLKKYNRYLVKKTSKPMKNLQCHTQQEDKLPEDFF